MGTTYRATRFVGLSRLLAVGVGVAIGMLVAPTSGADLRDRLRRRWRRATPPPATKAVAEQGRRAVLAPHMAPTPARGRRRGRHGHPHRRSPHETGKADIERAAAAVPGVSEVDSHRLVVGTTGNGDTHALDRPDPLGRSGGRPPTTSDRRMSPWYVVDIRRALPAVPAALCLGTIAGSAATEMTRSALGSYVRAPVALLGLVAVPLSAVAIYRGMSWWPERSPPPARLLLLHPGRPRRRRRLLAHGPRDVAVRQLGRAMLARGETIDRWAALSLVSLDDPGPLRRRRPRHPEAVTAPAAE